MPLPDWRRAYGAPLITATLRNSPEDFDVTEQLGFELSGDGEHDYLYIQKTGTNTDWLAGELARFARIPAKDVGYSGLKDRHAVTRQWFSVPRWNQPNWATFDAQGVQLLQVGRNARKLRRGAHRSNSFRIVLRDIDVRPGHLLDERLQNIRDSGVPNYFGVQRFGRGAGNLELADAWASGKRLPRQLRSLAISAARSFLFNQMLAVRVADGCWNKLIAGDVANLNGTGSVFDVDVLDKRLVERCRTLDIHPTALLWGDGASTDDIPEGHDNWLLALGKARVKPARRSLRLKVDDLQWRFDRDALELSFGLCRGAFATSVVREIST